MKDKALTFMAGLLIGAILTTGVFMLINKNNANTANNNRQNRNNGMGPIMSGDGQPPTQEQLDSMIRTEMEDGAVRYQSPDGVIMMQKIGPDGGSMSGGGPIGQ